jgi:hypothetical protein
LTLPFLYWIRSNARTRDFPMDFTDATLQAP